MEKQTKNTCNQQKIELIRLKNWQKIELSTIKITKNDKNRVKQIKNSIKIVKIIEKKIICQ